MSRVEKKGTSGNISYGIKTVTTRGTVEADRLVNKYVKLVSGTENEALKNKYYRSFEANLQKIYNKEASQLAEFARQVAANKGRPVPHRSPARQVTPSPPRFAGRPPKPPRITLTAAQMRNKIIQNLRARLANLERVRNHAQNAVNRKKREINGILALNQRA